MATRLVERQFFGAKVGIRFTVFGVILATLVFAAIRIGQAAEEQKKNPPRIQVIPSQHDFGEVPPKELSHTFIVKNNGESDLEIYHVWTSCGCTKASIDRKMIEPGKIARMMVNYDPNVHRSSREKKNLQIKRTIFIRSNDPRAPEKSVFIFATITEGE